MTTTPARLGPLHVRFVVAGQGVFRCTDFERTHVEAQLKHPSGWEARNATKLSGSGGLVAVHQSKSRTIRHGMPEAMPTPSGRVRSPVVALDLGCSHFGRGSSQNKGGDQDVTRKIRIVADSRVEIGGPFQLGEIMMGRIWDGGGMVDAIKAARHDVRLNGCRFESCPSHNPSPVSKPAGALTRNAQGG